MHPLKITIDAKILSIANAFPEATGIRVLKSAHVVVLFSNQKKLDVLPSTGKLPSRIWGMSYSFGIIEQIPPSSVRLGGFSEDVLGPGNPGSSRACLAPTMLSE